MANRKDGLPRRRSTPEERAHRRATKISAVVPQAIAQPDSPTSPRALAQASEMRASIMKEGAFGAPDIALDIQNLDEQVLLREYETMTAAVMAEEQELGKRNFWYFLTHHLFPTTWQQHYSPEFHKDICYELQDLRPGEDLWIFIQREGKKTFVADIGHTIWLIVNDPNIRVLLIGAREETVKPFARMILSAFEKGTPGFETFQAVYPDMVIEGRGMLKQSFQFIHPRRTIALPDPTFRASYIAVSGAGWRCLSGDSLIHTPAGLIPAQGLEVGSRVLTIRGRFQRILAKVAQPQGDRQLLSFKVVGFPKGGVKVTAEHPVAVWAEESGIVFKPAGEVRPGDFVPMPKPKGCSTHVIFKDAAKQKGFHRLSSDPRFWTLLGYYAAEGWRDKANNRCGVVFAKWEESYITEVEETVREVLGVPVARYLRDNAMTLRWSHKLFHEIVGQIGDSSETKKVPYWVMRAPIFKQKEFVRGYINGDAGVSISLNLLASVQLMLAGFNTRSTLGVLAEAGETRIQGRLHKTKKKWSLQIREQIERTPQSWFTPNYWMCRVDEVVEEPACGTVYDFKVEEDSTIVGLGLSMHNCDVLKFDDPVERRSVNTPEMSAKTSRQMMDLFPLVDTGSRYRNIIGLGTRWAYHDPYGLVIGEKPDDSALAQVALDFVDYPKPKVFIRHAMEDPKRLCEHCPPDVVRRHPHGHPSLGPEAIATCHPIHTRESLMQQFGRYKMDPNLGEALFWHQYQNVCMAPSAQKFKKEWFFDVEVIDFVAPKLRALLIDSASKDFQAENRGDFMVALFISFDDQGRALVRHGLRSNRWTKDEFQRQILAWCKVTGWWPRVVAKEKFGEGSGAFLSDIGKMFASEMRPVHLLAVTRPPELLRKNDWIVENLQGPFERGEVLWGSRVPREIRDRCEYELCNLNQVAHEDVADTLALGMVKGVRPVLAYRPGAQDLWEAPALGLYDPGAADAAPPNFGGQQSAISRAGSASRVQAAIQELGFSADVTWDPRPAAGLPAVALPDFE